MAVSNQRIIQLLGLYTGRTASEGDVRELADWFVNNDDDGSFENYVLGMWENYKDSDEEKVDWEKIYNRILENRNVTASGVEQSIEERDSQDDNIIKRPRKIFSIKRWLAAASIILVLGIGSLYFIYNV